MRKPMLLFLLVLSPISLMARTVAGDMSASSKMPELTSNERQEIAKIDGGMKTLIYDCISEGKLIPSVDQGLLVRNCINLIKGIYNSHSAKLKDKSRTQNLAARLNRQDILEICDEARKSERELCTKFAERFAVQIVRPPVPVQAAPYSQSAGAAH